VRGPLCVCALLHESAESGPWRVTEAEHLLSATQTATRVCGRHAPAEERRSSAMGARRSDFISSRGARVSGHLFTAPYSQDHSLLIVVGILRRKYLLWRCALVCERLRCEPWRPWERGDTHKNTSTHLFTKQPRFVVGFLKTRPKTHKLRQSRRERQHRQSEVSAGSQGECDDGL